MTTLRISCFYKELMAGPRMKPSSAPIESPVGSSFSWKPPFHTGELLPFLTIVMPVRNEERHIGDVLSQLESQNYPHDRFEILVADGNSTDATAKIVGEFARQTSISVRLLENRDHFQVQIATSGHSGVVIYVDGLSHSKCVDATGHRRSIREDRRGLPVPATTAHDAR
jgi:cellulose synthase/poly-beta-1,6-N-acetylglucosamine synthase-like glycosyltransferase